MAWVALNPRHQAHLVAQRVYVEHHAQQLCLFVEHQPAILVVAVLRAERVHLRDEVVDKARWANSEPKSEDALGGMHAGPELDSSDEGFLRKPGNAKGQQIRHRGAGQRNQEIAVNEHAANKFPVCVVLGGD